MRRSFRSAATNAPVSYVTPAITRIGSLLAPRHESLVAQPVGQHCRCPTFCPTTSPTFLQWFGCDRAEFPRIHDHTTAASLAGPSASPATMMTCRPNTSSTRLLTRVLRELHPGLDTDLLVDVAEMRPVERLRQYSCSGWSASFENMPPTTPASVRTGSAGTQNTGYTCSRFSTRTSWISARRTVRVWSGFPLINKEWT